MSNVDDFAGALVDLRDRMMAQAAEDSCRATVHLFLVLTRMLVRNGYCTEAEVDAELALTETAMDSQDPAIRSIVAAARRGLAMQRAM